MPEDYKITDLANAAPQFVGGAMMSPMPTDNFSKGIMFLDRVNQLLSLANTIIPNAIAAKNMLKPVKDIDLDGIGKEVTEDDKPHKVAPDKAKERNAPAPTKIPPGTSPPMAALAGNIDALKSQAAPMLAKLKEKAGDMKVSDLVEEFNKDPQSLFRRMRGE